MIRDEMGPEMGREMGRGLGRGIGRRIGIFIRIIIMLIIVVGVFGTGVYRLWNWLMPMLFKLPAITFSQGVGLLALSWLLFGGFRGFRGWGGRHRGGPWQRRMFERWEQMTPEEREKFREGLRGRGRCGRGPVEAQAKV
jgi:hypothetical protein